MTTTLRLLGPAAIDDGTERLPLPATRPAWLLAYLGATDGWVARSHLAYLFRADSPESVARHYVRNLLNRAQRLPFVGDLSVEATRCRWDVESDVGRFRRAIRAENWFDAVSCYSGPFLDGLVVGQAPVFENWLDTTRSQLHEDWQHATLQYAADQESSRCHDVAAGALKRFLDHDLLDEEVLQAYLRNAYLAGKRDQALEVATRFLTELASEMEVAPLPTTQDLIDKIRNGERVERIVKPRTKRRRWTDGGTEDPDELQELIALLKDPKNRLQTVVDSERTGTEAIVLTRRVREPRLTRYAIVELAETLLADGHHERVIELMVLVMSQEADHDRDLRERVQSLWEQLAPHVPGAMIRDSVTIW